MKESRMKRLISLCVMNLLLLGRKDSAFSQSSNSPLSSNSSLSPRCSSLLSISSLSPPSLPPAALAYMPYISVEDYVPSSVYCYLPAMQNARAQDCKVSPRFFHMFTSVPWDQYQTFSFRKTIITDVNRTVQDWFTDLVRSQASSPCTGGLNQVSAIAPSMISSLGPRGWHKYFTDFITSRSLYAVILNDETNLMFKDLIGVKFKNEFNYEFHTNSKEGIYVDIFPGDTGYGEPIYLPPPQEGQGPQNTTVHSILKNESAPCGPEAGYGAPDCIDGPLIINKIYTDSYVAAVAAGYDAPSVPYGTPTAGYDAPSVPYGIPANQTYGEPEQALSVEEWENNYSPAGSLETESDVNILDYMAKNIGSGLAYYLKNETNWSLASEVVGCSIDYLGESNNTMMEILVTNITKDEVVQTVERLAQSIQLLVEHKNLEEGLQSIFAAVVDAIRAIDFDKITLHVHQMVLRARTGAFGVDIAELLKTVLDMFQTLTSAAEAFKSGDWPQVNIFINKLVSVIESDEFWIGLDNAYVESVSNAKMLYYSRILSYRDAFLATLRHVTTSLELFVNDFDQNFDHLVGQVNQMKLDNCLVWLIDRPYSWLGPVVTSHGQLACWITDFVRRVQQMECLKMDWVDDFVDKEVWPQFPQRLLELWEKMGKGGKEMVQKVVGTCPRDGWFLWLK